MGTRQLIARAARPRRGLSLIEVMVALGLLGGVMLGLGMFTAQMSQSTSASRLRIQAEQAASDRIEQVKMATRYTAIESTYVATEVSWDAKYYPSFTRKTMVKHVGGGPSDSTDYKIVTVQVTHPQMSGSVRKTTVIAFF